MTTRFTEIEIQAINSHCESGNLQGIKQIVKGFKYYNNASMAIACKFGRENVVKYLHENTNNNNLYRNYEQAFRNSAEYQCNRACKWLLVIDPKLKISTDFKPFIQICESGNTELVKLILIHQPNLELSIMNLAFKLAFMNNHSEIVVRLRLANININVLGENNNLFLEYFNKNDLYNVNKLYTMQSLPLSFNMVKQAFIKQHFDLALWTYEHNQNIDLAMHNDVIIKQLCTDGLYMQVGWLLRQTPTVNVMDRYIWACKNNHLPLIQGLYILNKNYNICFHNSLLIRIVCTNKFTDLRNWLYKLFKEEVFDIIRHSDQVLIDACNDCDEELIIWILDKRVENGDDLDLEKLFKRMCYKRQLNEIAILYEYDNSLSNCVINNNAYPKISINFIKKLHPFDAKLKFGRKIIAQQLLEQKMIDQKMVEQKMVEQKMIDQKIAYEKEQERIAKEIIECEKEQDKIIQKTGQVYSKVLGRMLYDDPPILSIPELKPPTLSIPESKPPGLCIPKKMETIIGNTYIGGEMVKKRERFNGVVESSFRKFTSLPNSTLIESPTKQKRFGSTYKSTSPKPSDALSWRTKST
jgi:hypothetical protein